MPQVDVQWPSENEDFDATTSVSPSKTAVKNKPSITKVADDEPQEQTTSSESEEQPAQESVNDTSSVPADETPAQEETPEPQPGETVSADDHANQPDPDPVVEAEAANLASGVDNQQAAVSDLPVTKDRRKMPKFGMPSWRTVGEAVLVLAVIGLGLWSWNLYSDRKDLKNEVATLNANPQSVVQKQTKQLITKVGSLMQLPTGETPTVAEVSDATQAKQQSSFFNKAQNGDRVLMYVKTGEAILYRPSTNKIILVAPLVFTNTGGSTSTTGATTPTTSTTKK